MSKLNIGDIASLKALGEKHYYIVTNITDLTVESDEQPNVSVEIMLIYPIVLNPKPERVNENDLFMVSKFKSREYILLMKYIKNEREANKWFLQPEYLRIVGDDVTKYTNNSKKKTISNSIAIHKESKQILGEKEIRRILNDNQSEIRMEEFVRRMDTHLELLHRALQERNQKDIDFQKEQLEKVRQTLMELEYFQFEKRRSGTSIRIK